MLQPTEIAPIEPSSPGPGVRVAKKEKEDEPSSMRESVEALAAGAAHEAYAGVVSVLELHGNDNKPETSVAREHARRRTGIKDEHGNQLSMMCRVHELGRAGLATELFFRTLRYAVGAAARPL
jgi:hypothetical protein